MTTKRSIRWPTIYGGVLWAADQLRAPVIRGPAVTDEEARAWPGCRVVVGVGPTAEYAWLIDCIERNADYSLWRVAHGPVPPLPAAAWGYNLPSASPCGAGEECHDPSA